MRRTALATTLTILAATVAAGCGTATEEPPLFAVLDHTGSSAEGSTRLCAADLVAFAHDRYGGMAGSRGEVRADLFDARTAASPTFPARATFSVDASKQSNMRHTLEDLAKDEGALAKELHSMIDRAGPSRGGTDVVTMLASLGTAAHAADARLVWICTDARDRRLPKQFGRRDVERVLRAVRSNDALPDLHGIDVVMDTVTVRGHKDLDSGELAALRLFVERLVALSGGRLIAYGPSPTASRQR